MYYMGGGGGGLNREGTYYKIQHPKGGLIREEGLMEKGGGLIRAFMVGICAQSCLNYFYFHFFFHIFQKQRKLVLVLKELVEYFQGAGGISKFSKCTIGCKLG